MLVAVTAVNISITVYPIKDEKGYLAWCLYFKWQGSPHLWFFC